MTHVLQRMTRRIEASMKRRQTSRRIQAALQDPHLAKDVGLPHEHRPIRKPILW